MFGNQLSNRKQKITPSVVCLFIMSLLTLLIGIIPQQRIIGTLIFCLLIPLWCRGEIYLAFPFILFYNEFYGVVLGLSLIRWFVFLLLSWAILKIKKPSKIKIKYLFPLIVYTLYVLFVMMPISSKSVVFDILEVICIIVLVANFLVSDGDRLRRFFKVYIVVCILSFITGMVIHNYMAYGNLSRFMATFEDPNYMGFFCTIGIFAMVTLELFNKKIRLLLTVLLYFVIILSASVSAIIVNVILWVVYFSVVGKMSIKSGLISIGFILILVVVYQYELNNSELSSIGQVVTRIEEKIAFAEAGQYAEATTGRTNLMEEHFNFFLMLPAIQKLFGGIPVNTSYVVPVLEEAAHNEYIDMLLNVGLIGSAILLIYAIRNLIHYIADYYASYDRKYLCLVMLKFVWMIYACTLTVFLDYRFLLFYFI